MAIGCLGDASAVFRPGRPGTRATTTRFCAIDGRTSGRENLAMFKRAMWFRVTSYRCSLVALATGLSVAEVSAQAASVPAGRDLGDLVTAFTSERGSVDRFYDLPWSEARFERLERLHREWQQRVDATAFDSLNQDGRIDHILLRLETAAELDRVGLYRRRLEQMNELLAFRAPIQKLEQARWRFEPPKLEEAASSIAAIPDQIAKLRQRIEKRKKEADKSREEEKSKEGAKTEDRSSKTGGTNAVPADAAALKVSPGLALRVAGAAEDIRRTLRNWSGYYEGYLPEFAWWMKRPCEDANRALEEYAKFLREEIANVKGKDEDPLIGDPVGAEELARQIRRQFLAYTADELIAIGEEEFAWCEKEMRKAASEMGFGDDWKAALDKVKKAYVPPGEQDRLVAEAGRDAIRFVKDRDLVTVPPTVEETWRVTMLSPEAQKTIPYAAYGGQNMMVAYAREDMKHDDKLMSMRGNNRHFTRIVTAHELVPGHHLQSRVGSQHRTYRSIFGTPFFFEGWALYWEMRLWDLGYARTPEERVGMLFWRMHRSARIVVSLRFQMGRMTPQEMVDFLVNRVGHEKLGARSEVRRFIGDDFSPLYQCGYMIGGLQLRALHREATGPGRLTERQFHDAVLTYNAIPVELLRAGLLNLPLTRDAHPAWLFVGRPPKPE